MPFITFKANLAKNKPNTLAHKKISCPFCDEETLKNDGNILSQEDDFILIKNKFPVLENTFQTVLIEHKSCEEHIGTYSIEYLTKLLEFAFKEYDHLKNSKDYRSIVLFKNHGLQSGGSINHAHMQLVGLRDVDYIDNIQDEDFSGVNIISNPTIEWNISSKPKSEFFEINIVLKDTNDIKTLATYIQRTVNYILHSLNSKYQSYNLAFYIAENEIKVKVFSRSPNSVYLLGFGIHQTPNNLEDIAAELRQLNKDSSNE